MYASDVHFVRMLNNLTSCFYHAKRLSTITKYGQVICAVCRREIVENCFLLGDIESPPGHPAVCPNCLSDVFWLFYGAKRIEIPQGIGLELLFADTWTLQCYGCLGRDTGILYDPDLVFPDLSKI